MLTWASFLAFHARTLGRLTGAYHPVFGQDIDRRAGEYLEKLRTPSAALRFEIALQNIMHEGDLLMEEAALTPNGLALQARLFELSDRSDTAREILKAMFSGSLFPGILRNIVTEAKAKAAQAIYFKHSDQVSVSFEIDGLKSEVAEFPPDVWPSIRGHLLRVQRVGFLQLEPYYMFREQLTAGALPEQMEIDWQGDGLAVIRIG